MNLEAMNSFVSVGVGVNLVFGLFDGVKGSICSYFQASFDRSVKEINNNFDEAKKAKLLLPNVEVKQSTLNAIEESFRNGAVTATKSSKIFAFVASTLLSLQLWIVALVPQQVSVWVAYIDAFIVLLPLIVCIVWNFANSMYYKYRLHQCNIAITGLTSMCVTQSVSDTVSSKELTEILQ